MSDELKEAISALADGERGAGNRSVLIDKITHEPSSRLVWERYHLLSDAIKDRLPDRVHTDLADRVRDAIAREPIALATRRRVRILKPLTGLALAASVATIAILVVRNLDSDEGPTAPVAVSEASTNTGNGWNESPEVAARLNGYALNHTEYVGYGMHGMLPYARIRGYDSDE